MLNVIVLLLSLSVSTASSVSKVPYSHIVENDYLRTAYGENIDYVLANNDYFVGDKIVFSHDLYEQGYSFNNGIYIGGKNDIEYALLYRVSNIPFYSSDIISNFDYDMTVYLNLVLGARPIASLNKNYYAIGLMGAPILVSNYIYTNVGMSFMHYSTLDYIDFELKFDSYDELFYFNGVMRNLTFYKNPDNFFEGLITIENNTIKQLVFDLFDWQYIGASSIMFSWFNNFSDFNYFGLSSSEQNIITIVSHEEYLPNTTDYKDYYTDIGFDLGYNSGYDDGFIAKGVDGWLISTFTGMGSLLSIELLPNLTIGSIILIFLAIPLTYAIIKLMKGGD